MEEDILYSDFKGIRITSKKFYAGQKAYALRQINKINLKRVTPHKLRGMILFVIGIVAIILGSLEMLQSVSFDMGDEIWLIDLNFVSIGFGVIALLWAIVRMLLFPDEFAVQVEIKDGTVESIQSDSRKYAARLAASLKRAYYRQEEIENDNDKMQVA
ncbi:hypothetical protein E1176_09655 [Fulvivirga sp. RKSG066]|uniref:DUF6232 family protein n=1 Tax=Fulvivirga aurantia TaxID=2529383 RepID=UPI0012BCA10B|nr:DUF6232 family protein [Fulvivirga aurantia]MTI21285.1 hypothetical protein [Fulvivirga aurantia]